MFHVVLRDVLWGYLPMEKEELALSDVQIDEVDRQRIDIGHYDSYQLNCSRFFVYEQGLEPSNDLSPTSDGKVTASVDEDGDLIVPRIVKYIPDFIIEIEHTLETTISDVGLQIWQGCLFLCDFILENGELFDGKTVLELGAGVGLASIVAARYAKSVICSDVQENILSLCVRNAEKNRSLHKYNSPGSQQNVIKVRKWDWLKADLNKDSGEFSWNEADLSILEQVDLIIAADVIYDDKLTDAFFNVIERVMAKDKSKTLYLALEKRWNFTISDLQVCCPAYTYFEVWTQRLLNSTDISYTVEQILEPVNQHLQYARTNNLELWKISSLTESSSGEDSIPKLLSCT